MGIFQSSFFQSPIPQQSEYWYAGLFNSAIFQHPSQWMFTSIPIEGDQFQAIATFFILTRSLMNKKKGG